MITVGTVTTLISDTFASSTDLLADLIANVTFAAADEVSLVTITGTDSWAGSYIAYNNGADAHAFAADDTIIKVNSIANVEIDTFNV